MIYTPPIMLNAHYSSLSLLFGTLKKAQIIYLVRRPKERIVGVLVYAQLL